MKLESNEKDSIAIGHHATSLKQAESILEEKTFKFNKFNQNVISYKRNEKTKMPNDLGNGAYFFIEDKNFGISSKNIAKEYYKNVKQKTQKYDGQIIQVSIDISDKFVKLDFNNSRNICKINKYKQQNLDRINKVFNEYIEINSTYNRAKKLGLIDGLAIEMMLFEIKKNKNIEVDYICLDTQIDIQNYRTRINNAREMCIRNQNMILSIERGD
ncbi:hypothetical protein [Staphylococcus epidermidis]|uniref:hypothetical protein n=1 Tax=Staphylococcus epidermidis TaxID=1282 RepID=UPI002550C254|nr:hypothetical protein [Staphylococcus epidermidis]MDK7902795.1 hypothetical protein [Staphylococcus epidermidis]MDK8779915.1 hypothetical protein [Staphylococcus epidermidis]WJD66091.1 hypothetical protein QQ988_09360 [Staphylococcus epidermidis]